MSVQYVTLYYHFHQYILTQGCVQLILATAGKRFPTNLRQMVLIALQ